MTDRQKPSATMLWGCTSDTMRWWLACRREALQCASEGCKRERYKDMRMCLGHQVMEVYETYQGEEFRVRLAAITGTTSSRRLAAAIRERIDAHGWSQAEWTSMIGIPQSSGSKAIRDPDGHVPTFEKIASHFGFERMKDGSYRKRAVNGRAA